MVRLQFHPQTGPSACSSEMKCALGRGDKQVQMAPISEAPLLPRVWCPRGTESMCFCITLLFLKVKTGLTFQT